MLEMLWLQGDASHKQAAADLDMLGMTSIPKGVASIVRDVLKVGNAWLNEASHNVEVTLIHCSHQWSCAMVCRGLVHVHSRPLDEAPHDICVAITSCNEERSLNACCSFIHVHSRLLDEAPHDLCVAQIGCNAEWSLPSDCRGLVHVLSLIHI